MQAGLWALLLLSGAPGCTAGAPSPPGVPTPGDEGSSPPPCPDFTLRGEGQHEVGRYPQQLAVADLQGDGAMEVLVTLGYYGVQRWSQDDAGHLALEEENGTEDYPDAVAVGHLNQDAVLDIVVAASNGACVILSDEEEEDGFDHCGRYIWKTLNFATTFLFLVDVDGDEHLDLVGEKPGDPEFDVAVVPGRGDGEFAGGRMDGVEFEGYSVMGMARYPDRRDPPEFVVWPSGEWIYEVAGHEDDLIEKTSSCPTGPPGSWLGPKNLALGDVDEDSILDAVTVIGWYSETDTSSTGDGAFEGYGLARGWSPGFSEPEITAFGLDLRDVELADLDADGHLDLVLTDTGDPFFTGEPAGVWLLLGQGDGTFEPHLLLDAAPYPTFATVADMNADGRPDLVVLENVLDRMTVYTLECPSDETATGR